MRQWKRLLFLLLLNVFVSACTVLIVLFIWDRAYGPLPKGLLSGALSPQSTSVPELTFETPETPQPIPQETEEYFIYEVQAGDTFESIALAFNMPVSELVSVNGYSDVQPLSEGEILRIPLAYAGSLRIESVIGAGDLDTERVLIKYQGQGEISLLGWQLEDGRGHVYTFPAMILFSGGAVNVYTKDGQNTVVELYWGLDEAIWLSGATVTLRDAQGEVRATYQVP